MRLSMKNLKITDIKATPITIPFHQPAVLSFGVVDKRSYVVLRIYTNQGILGVGEAAPLPIYSEESVETVKFTIDRYLAPAIIGMNPFDLGRILVRFDQVIKGNPVAKAGMEYSLWDIMGKALEVPLYQLMGGLYREEVPLSIHSIGIGKTKKVVEEAVAKVESGMSLIKLKIGLDPLQDVKNLKAVREAVGGDIGLYVDANQGYSRAAALKTLRRLEEFDLLRIEQPISKYDVSGMAEICRAIDTPIMADEAVGDVHEVHYLLENKAADIINIKSVMHGLSECKKIATVCEAANIPCYRGSMASLGICDAAEVHLVASTPNIIFPENPGANRSEELVDTVLKERLMPEKGILRVPHTPGIGVELDEKKLKKFKIDI
jgi:L-alanine-DL-glutamate epimerase-like enolase superfamily enzyme